MKRILFPAILVSMACVAAGFAKEPQPVAGSMKRFQEEAIRSGEVWGLVTLVGDRDGVLSLEASGVADIATKKPMTTDAIFWIASMSKPVAGVAVMMLAEKGLISVDDPVAKYLPEFKDLKDPDGKDAAITIANCLSHTAGLQELTPAEDLATKDLEGLTAITAKKPTKVAPGTQWVYCQTGIATAARIVEVVSGKTYPEYLQENLFDPLGMKDTTFYQSGEQVARTATSYEKKDGELKPVIPYFLGGRSSTDTTRYPRPSGGLYSTISDYGRFASMLLRGGELDGKRYLKPETIAAMTKIRTGELKYAFVPGTFYGLGCGVIREPGGVTAALSPGSFGHGGAYGTQAWIDPVKGRYSVMMVQRANWGSGDASTLRGMFQDAAAK